jgi:hypothetical protein
MVAGRYLLQRRLGRGGAKDVWLAHDLTLDRPVALARMSGPGAWERMRREARLTARLGGHRHIVTVHDVFEDAGTPVLVARYMTGGSLADRMVQTGRLPLPEAVRAAREIAEALAHTHANAIVHRDVKPDNVWLDAEGEAALGDFGVALADGEEAVRAAGTPLYAAPEQASGAPVSERSDLYGLGATLYELLCGRASLAMARVSGFTPPSQLVAGIPEALEELLLALLARDPAGRPGSAAEVSRALTALVGRPPAAAPAGVVGRAAELERLYGELTRAWDGAARTVTVVGEPGIGKTTLLTALAGEARRRGGTALWGRSEPDGRAYGVWRPIVRALAAAAPSAPDPVLERLTGDGGAPGGEDDRLRLFDAVGDLVAAAAEKPLLLLLEDLHLADASSLRLLEHVVDGASGARLLVACSAWAPLDLHGEVVELAGLAPEAVRALLPAELAPEKFEAVRERTAGNPFFVVELARRLAAGGAGEVPLRVREVVRVRLEELGPETGPLLEAAAVAGRFTIADLVRVAGAPRDAAAAAVERGVAARLLARAPDDPGHFLFAHAIVRDAAYEGLPERRRAELHAAVADALRARRDAGADVPAARIAHHALAAARLGGDPQPAWEAAREAAREAAAVLGHAEAAAHFAEALDALALGAEAPARERRETLLALADATFAAGDIEQARRRYSQAAAAARRDDDAATFAQAAVGFARVSQYGVVEAEGVALLNEALDRLPPEDGPLRARVKGVLAHHEPQQSRREELIDEALAMARRMDDEATLGWLYPLAVGVNWRAERAAQRAAAAEEVVRAAALHADHMALAWAYLQLVRDAVQAGDVARADALLDRVRPVADATRRTFVRWMVLVAEAGRAAFAGRLEDADRLTEEALEVNRRHGEDCLQEHTVQRLVLARLRRRPQDVDLARLRGFAARYPHLPVWEAMLAGLEWELGDVGAARRGVTVCARDGFAAVASSPDFLAAALCLADPTAGSGEPEQVAQLYALLAPHARENPVLGSSLWAAWGPVARGLGLLAAADDRPRDAAGHFAEALALADAWDAPAWALRTIGDWLATGVPVPDRAALAQRGLLLARELELPALAARIADESQTITP